MAYDAFLKIDGITSDKLSGIQLESFSWGVSNSSAASEGTGAGAGKVALQDFSFTSLMGGQSPQLFRKAVTGEVLQSATLTISGGRDIFIKFSDVIISSYKMDEHAQANFLKIERNLDALGGSGAFPNAAPADAVSFNFAKIEMSVGGIVGTGSSGGPVG
ncbi:MAG TPA: type VI secretion system tube protein Hcp [Terriglobales bacterium]|nr:type VI secretion system tube protein Hcp [Terriglobales bacterium]